MLRSDDGTDIGVDYRTCRRCKRTVITDEAVKGNIRHYFHPQCFLDGCYPVTRRTRIPAHAREELRDLLIREGWAEDDETAEADSISAR
jgi:hypothetical protein